MIYQTLDDIYAMMERQHTQFVASLQDVNETQAQFRPAAEEWNIAEIAEHLSITNHGFLRITYKLLKQAEAAGTPPLAELSLHHVLLDEAGCQNPAKFPAPEIVKPKGGQALADSLTKLAENLAEFHTVQPRLAAVDCSSPKFPHPAAGEINAYQWMIVLGEHLDRHRTQIERLKETPGYPA